MTPPVPAWLVACFVLAPHVLAVYVYERAHGGPWLDRGLRAWARWMRRRDG